MRYASPRAVAEVCRKMDICEAAVSTGGKRTMAWIDRNCLVYGNSMRTIANSSLAWRT